MQKKPSENSKYYMDPIIGTQEKILAITFAASLIGIAVTVTKFARNRFKRKL